MHEVGPPKLSPADPRVATSDKTYAAFKAMDMGFDAHMTVHYFGRLSVLQAELAQQVLDGFTHGFETYFVVERLDFAMLGPNHDIPVIKVDPHSEQLLRLRDQLINHSYLPNPSEYDWNPHITLKMSRFESLHIPPVIRLHKLGLY